MTSKAKTFQCRTDLLARVSLQAELTGKSQVDILNEAIAAGLEAIANQDSADTKCPHCGWSGALTHCGNCSKPLRSEAA